MTVELLQPILQGGIRTTNFFNGRLLTADDFQTLQQAILERELRLGRAIGAGVVTGLEIELDAALSTQDHPVLDVGRGMAINERGDVLALPADVTIGLTREPKPVVLGNADFNVCPPPDSNPPPGGALTNLGFYILTILPASGFEGRAPRTQLVDEGVAGECGSRFAISGVRFRLVRVPLIADMSSTTLRQQVVQTAGDLDALIPQLAVQNPPLSVQQDVFRKTSLVRNGLAHLCFGSDRWSDFPTDPLAFLGSASNPTGPHTLLDELRDNEVLTDQEVPLGLVSWTSQGVKFVDQWAVRRPLKHPGVGELWPARPFSRRVGEILAMMLQSQQQLSDLATDVSTTGAPVAREWLLMLPSLMWIGGAPNQASVDPLTLMNGLTVRGPVYIEGMRLLSLIEVALAFGPRPVDTPEFFWHYLVRENRQSVDDGSLGAARRYTVIATGHIPDFTNPRFDLARFDYSNVSIDPA
jgi:hypothetical protein